MAGRKPRIVVVDDTPSSLSIYERSTEELAETEWAEEWGAVVEVDDRAGGALRMPGAPWRFSDAEVVGVSGVPRYRGEDNRAVLAELLGYDEAHLDRLEADGVLSSRVPAEVRRGDADVGSSTL